MSISHGHQEKSRLGRLLVNRGYLSEDQLEKGLSLQRETGQRLGEILIQAGWVSEQELHRVLKHQSRYRNAAAFVAAVALPFQPLVSFASTNPSSAYQAEDAGQLYEIGSVQRLTPLSEKDMADVTGQGVNEFLNRIAAVDQMTTSVRYDGSSDNGSSAGDSPDVIEGLKLVVTTLVPIASFLDSDFSMAGIEYDNSQPRYELRKDGALELALPTRIERISMDNISVRGGQNVSMGSISLHNIRFHPDSSMVIHTR